MDYTTLKNIVFQKYYLNSYLPGILGAYESSTIFNYLMTLESIQENLTSEMNISERWIDNIPTWYTSQLPQLFFVHKFNGETDQEYIDRLLLLTEVSQNDDTIKMATFSVVEKAITGIEKITIIEQLDGVSTKWGNVTGSNDWDGVSVWNDLTNVPRTLFIVNIEILNRGSNIDITTWDYWILSENYTKIEDIVNLYKPPGSTFELRLVAPTTWSISNEIFSNTVVI